ncbi:hypothetical protein FRB97_004498, partial [Tulasnella sp. 331]
HGRHLDKALRDRDTPSPIRAYLQDERACDMSREWDLMTAPISTHDLAVVAGIDSVKAALPVPP